MILISKTYQFDAAHKLVNPDWSPERNGQVYGKCARLHGHTYQLTVELFGDVMRDGMILNYFALDDIIKPWLYDDDTGPDHNYLNEIFPDIITTSEKMVDTMAGIIQNLMEAEIELPDDLSLSRLLLKETPKTEAVWLP